MLIHVEATEQGGYLAARQPIRSPRAACRMLEFLLGVARPR